MTLRHEKSVVAVDSVVDPLGPRNLLGTTFDTRETQMRRESRLGNRDGLAYPPDTRGVGRF